MGEVPTDYGILVGVDGSAESDAAIRWVTREATMRGMPITLMHVVPPIPEWPTPSRQSEIAEAWEQNARDVIAQARKTVVASGGESDPPDLRAEVVSSTVVPTLIDASQRARMIVMGSRGMGALGRFLLGSVSSGLVHHAHCPVAIIHADEGSADDKAPILVGVDGSPASEGAIELAFEEASRRGVDLVALHAWSDVGSSRFSAWTGENTKPKARKSWPNAWQVGKNNIPTCRCSDGSSATNLPTGSLRNPNTLSSWWSAAMAAADSPTCCWAQ